MCVTLKIQNKIKLFPCRKVSLYSPKTKTVTEKIIILFK